MVDEEGSGPKQLTTHRSGLNKIQIDILNEMLINIHEAQKRISKLDEIIDKLKNVKGLI